MFAHGSASSQLFPVLWIFLKSLCDICFYTWILSEGHKNYLKEWCLMNSQPAFVFLTYLNSMNEGHFIKSMQTRRFWDTRVCKAYLYEYSSPLYKFCWLWIFLWIKLTWHSCSMWDKPGCFNWFSQFFLLRGYSPLIQKGSSTNMHGLSVYGKERLPFAGNVSLENSANSCLCFQLALLYSVSWLPSLSYWSPSLSLCTVFDYISPK